MPADALIIQADDFGLWPSVSAGIFAAWENHAISGTSVLVNTPELASLIARAQACALPVGLHLNLTYGTPLCSPGEIPALVNAQGVFVKRTQWSLPLPIEQVQLELHRQISRLQSLGYQPTHLDSHHHIHAYPDILPVVAALAYTLSVPVRAVDDSMRQVLQQAGISSPTHFSMAFYGKGVSNDTLIELIESCPGGVLEIMTHPGYNSAQLPSSYRSRELELQTLLSPRWREYLAVHKIPIIGYKAI